MTERTLTDQFLRELESEVVSTKKCLERIPEDRFRWKPHEKSLDMGYVGQIVAEIPRWISTAIEVGEINFGTFKHNEMKNGAELLAEFESNMEGARKALAGIGDESLEKMFALKAGDQVLMSDSVRNTISSSINHLVHHRGQLTVYFRLAGIPVPSIYGPSGDEKTF